MIQYVCSGERNSDRDCEGLSDYCSITVTVNVSDKFMRVTNSGVPSLVSDCDL